MRKKKYRPWLRAFSGLFINISAAWFASSFIGTNISFPQTIFQFFALTLQIGFGIVFLLLTVRIEKELGK